VHVEEMRLAGVDAGAQVLVRLIGRAELDGIGLGEGAVERRAGGGTGDDADLEIAAGGVFGLGFFRDGGGDDFGGTGGGETAEADDLVVLDECGGFFGSEDGERWFMVSDREAAGMDY
jgi:hypothetical protein